jgi:tetratricopeptide (TPR) repeat protein
VTRHLDELTLLLYTVRDLDPEQVAATAAHLSNCKDCAVAFTRIREIDLGLRGLAAQRALTPVPNPIFDVSDPFRRRPLALRSPQRPLRAAKVDGARALADSERAVALSEQILAAMKKPGGVDTLLPQLSLNVAHHRFALLYALQEAGRQSAENPIRIKDFARQAIDWLRRQRSAGESDAAERMVPKLTLRAHAHMLLAIASLWTKEFSRARSHLVVAYRSFGPSAQETSLALVELNEAQRRALTGEGPSALALAKRARETFEAQGMEDYAARARAAEGLAHIMLKEPEEALEALRSALPVFERHGLWSNYVGTLNNAATFLTSLGRFEEARRDYARALRRLSREEHRYWIGYLRVGFAEALFAAGRFDEAAAAASRAGIVFEEAGLRAHHLIAMLLEVESWARHGSLERARRRLEIFWKEIARDQALDSTVLRELGDALSGANPDYQAISGLRRQIDDMLRQRYGSTPA